MRRKKKDWSKIESKNAEMKQAKRDGKSQIRGLLSMKTQALLTSIVVNVKRIVKLIETKPAE